ncbi:hypothetical protein B0H63DRAFT_471243 [Podospora didyma]|uniref:Uncharacterized protein n=1 Tax=Podospora didyma TaxID=330526 RepID=A0AAE0U2A8_9PEZI|nr:hypothetical protein B0H63DRAFT_471243 [Podospora didyma]
MAEVEEFGVPVDFVEDPGDHGFNRTYVGNPLFQVEASGFTSTVTEQYALHGYLSSEGKELASLVVVHFSLYRSSGSRGRRFRSVTISLTFVSSTDQPSDDPAVRCFAPAQDGAIGVIPTTVQRQVQHNGNVSAKIDAAPAPVNLGFLYERKDQAEFEQHLLATISAKPGVSTRTRDRDGHNVVEWTITENHREKLIPDSYQLAVVIERKNDEPFTVQAKVNASVDALHAISEAAQRFVGLRQPVRKYDPIRKREVGTLEYPENTRPDRTELKSLVKGRELDKYSYVHVVEQVAPVSIYGGVQPSGGAKPEESLAGGGRADASQDGANASLSFSVQLGGGGQNAGNTESNAEDDTAE